MLGLSGGGEMSYSIEEYNQDVENLLKEFEKNKFNLSRKYALDKNPYSIGDILESNTDKIKVEKIKIYKGGGFMGKNPCCVYYGPELRKDLVPKKSGVIGSIFQERVVGRIEK